MSGLNTNNSSTTGAFRQSWKRANPRSVLMRVLAANPDWDKIQAQAETWILMTKGVKGSLSYLQAVFEYWFDNNYDSLVNPREKRRRKTASATANAPSVDPQTNQSAASPGPEPPSPAAGSVKTTADKANTAVSEIAFVQQADLKASIDVLIKKKIKTALLDLTLPSGKTLRHSTREELLECGGWMIWIAEELHPGQTPDEAGISEARAQEIYAKGL